MGDKLYIPFTEQISKICVDVTRWHSTLVSNAAQKETYFNDAVVKYIDLDYGSYFQDFLNDIPYSNGELQTYAQLLHQKDVVAKALINHLNIVESSSLNTLLQLTVAFAQDLREDFQCYLWDFMETIIALLERSHEDVEIIETGFFTLAKIFWLHRKCLVRELREVFRRFNRLFTCKRFYLRRFIAEALAFLLRKSSAVDKLTLFLAEAAFKEDNNPTIDSISQLYFNALKVNKGQFHSVAPQVLQEILRTTLRIGEGGLRDVAVEILEGTMRYCATYTAKEYSGPILDILLNQYKSSVESSNKANACVLAKLLNAWISQKNGKSFHNPSSLFQTLVDAMKKEQGGLDKEIIGLLSISLISYHRDNELQSLISSAVRAVTDNGQRCDIDLILGFFDELSNISLFDFWIMPAVGTFMSRFITLKDNEIDKKIFKFYAFLCNRRKPIWAPRDHQQHFFFDASNHLEVRRRMTEILKSPDNHDKDIVGCCLMVYPWFWRKSENPEEIDAVFRILRNSLNEADARIALLAANACSVFDPSMFSWFTLDDLLKSYTNMGKNESALHVLSLMLPFVKDFAEQSSVSTLSRVANELLSMFGHWSSYVRQNAIKVLSHFKIPLNNVENSDGTIVEAENAFSLLLTAEKTPWTLEDYRTRLMILRQLNYGSHKKHVPRDCDTVIETIPLRVIIGNLHEPFTVAWPELKNIICEYAYGLNIDIFFTLFFSFLDDATAKINLSEFAEKTCENVILDKITSMTEKFSPDYGTFRLEMLGILVRISDIAERRTKLISPMLIGFYRNEFQRGNILEKRENILLPSSERGDVQNDALDEENTNDYENAELSDTEKVEDVIRESELLEGSTNDGCITRKVAKRTLITILELFGNFNAPKSIYMAKEVRDLYDELLMISDEKVQQLTMKCIFSYKYKYLMPYREYIDVLVSDRTFISGLLKFSIDDQNCIIDDNHRTDVMPIILSYVFYYLNSQSFSQECYAICKVLYGKYNVHCQRDVMERRTAIFQFLGGCKPDELDFFLKLLFAPLLKVTGEDDESVEVLCKQIVSTFDSSSVIPLSVIKGSFWSISQVAHKLSPTLTNAQRRFLFRLCLAAALLSRLAMQNLHLVQPYHVKRLKELRRLACSTFKEIFEACQVRKFENDELVGFLKYFVCPQCTLQNDGNLLTPLSLLRLFLSWTSVPKLFPLLRLQVPLNETTTPSVFSVLCGMLASNSVKEHVKEKIIDGVLSLLTLSDEEGPDQVADVDLAEVQDIPDVNNGTKMVIGELPKLLEFIFGTLKSQNNKLNVKYLEVLNRISDFVQDGEKSERFVSVLLKFIEAGTVRSDNALQSLLITVSRMITVTTNSAQFLKNLLNLQCSLKERSVREALQKVEEAIALRLITNEQRQAELLRCIVDLDAWDGCRIGEPDHDKRHAAYTHLHQALAANETITPILLFLALYNDFHVITQMKDISLRSAAYGNFRDIIKYFGNCDMLEAEKLNAVDSHMLNLILKGLHEEKEAIRHDFVNLLVTLIVIFPQHKDLRHLLQLRNTAEVDLDFFENVVHLQIHRRQRAFYRLSRDLQSEKMHIPSGILLRFMIPLLQPYILEVSSNTSALSDAALRLLTQIMRKASWKKYFPMLDYYLKRLKKENVNHKAVVRVIVAIVDAFHFNVSDENEVEQFEPAIKRRKIIVDLEPKTVNKTNAGDVDDADIKQTEETTTENLAENHRKGIYQKVVRYLLPRLKDCATGKDLTSHRKAQSMNYYKEDDDIQRAPVALATVRLLQKLPQTIMDQNLHGVIIKMRSLLMSRSVGVREVAGKTIIEIAKTLGPKYLRFIIREMKQSIPKGYQVHVVIFYVHKLLSAMEEQLCPGDLDSCMMDIIEMCNMDLFGDIAEEKTVTGITKNVPEAKTQRAYETYKLLGRYISSQCLGNVLTTLKQAVISSPNLKTIKKVGRLLYQYSLGISANGGIEPSVALVFVFQVLKEHMAEVLKETKNDDVENVVGEKETRRPESCLLLEKEPNRIGTIVKVSKKSKMHIFVEFGLFELYSILKKKTFDPESSNDVGRLDPFVNMVLQCLHLKYDQILINSLRCFLLLLRFPLPSLRTNMPQFLNRFFILLADYTALGAAGNSQEYVRKSMEVSQLVFKAFTQIIKDAPNLVLTSERIQLLLTYVETDIVDSQKQAVAFPLIKAIFARKLQGAKSLPSYTDNADLCDDENKADESIEALGRRLRIVEVVQYLSEIAIISEVSHIREQCRQSLSLFIGIHPQCKKPMKYIEFFLEQLEYEYEDGRKSAIEMLNLCFEKLKKEINDQYALLAFVKLSVRLINDESTECRQMVALAIQHLIKSVSESKRNDLYLTTRDWLESKKEAHVCIALQIMVMFSKLRGEKFTNTFLELSPILSKIIHSDLLFSYAEESIGVIIDSLTLMLTNLRDQIAQFTNDGLLDSILKEMGTFSQCHESPMVQLAAARFFGLVFSALDHKCLLLRTDPSPRKFMQWTLAQIKTFNLSDELVEQAAKNIVYLFNSAVQSNEDLKWLCHRLSLLCKFEMVVRPAEALRRISVFKVAAAIVLKIDPSRAYIVAEALLPSLYREMQGKSTQNTEILRQIAKEVAETMKIRLGEEEFLKRLSECQKLLAAKFEERKRRKKEEAVLDPVSAARKKLRKNKAKRGVRKQKIDKKKGLKRPK